MVTMKKVAYIVPLLFIAALFSGCVGTETPKAGAPEADGKALYNYITTEKNYKNWKMWPGKGELYNGTEPHGALLTTYVTDAAFSAVEGKRGSIPDGSIIVKENYMPDKTLDAITVMYKIKGYDADNNDWFWAKYSPDGTVQDEGKIQGCIDCHGQRRDHDLIWTSDLK